MYAPELLVNINTIAAMANDIIQPQNDGNFANPAGFDNPKWIALNVAWNALIDVACKAEFMDFGEYIEVFDPLCVFC